MRLRHFNQEKNMSISLKIFELNLIENSIGRERSEKIEDFVTAVQEDGFIGIKIKGLEEVMQKGYEVAKLYFSLPTEVKEEDVYEPAKVGGYQPLARERIGNLKEVNNSQTEFKESYLLLGGGIRLPTTKVEGFEQLSQFRTKMHEIANRILHIFYEYFQVKDCEKMNFDEKSAYSTTRLAHYPAMQDAPPNSVWCAPHVDISPFALMPRATSIGLQLQKKSDHSWATVDVPENTIIFNTGRFFETVTAGLIKPTLHRVCSDNLVQDRYSIIFFPSWNSSYEIKPWEGCLQKATHSMCEEEIHTFVKNSLLIGKVERLFHLFAALSRNIEVTEAQVLGFAKEFPYNEAIKKMWPQAYTAGLEETIDLKTAPFTLS